MNTFVKLYLPQRVTPRGGLGKAHRNLCEGCAIPGPLGTFLVRGERSTQQLPWSVEEVIPALTMTLWVQDLGGGSRCDVVGTAGDWS